MVFIAPSVIIRRDPLSGTPQVTPAVQRPALVARSDGELVLVSSEKILKGIKGSKEALANSPAEVVISISDAENGVEDYVLNQDFQLVTSQIDWGLNSVIVPPSLITPSVVNTGGALAAATYFYVVTAIRATDVSILPNTIGETTKSNEQSASVATPGAGVVTLTWAKVRGATGYRIYRSLTSGNFPAGYPYGAGSLVATVLGENTTTFVDDGSITLSDGAPPTTNTAFAQPAKGADYFVSYRFRVFDFEPEFFTSLANIKIRHGLGSDISTAAQLIMGRSGTGNSAPGMWVVAAQDDSDAAYVIAIEKLAGKDVQLLCYTRTSQALHISALLHAIDTSKPENQKERRVIAAAAAATPIGDVNSSGSLLFNANSLKNSRIMLLGANGSFNAQVEDSVGNVAKTLLSPAFFACATAGMITSLPDPAEPPTNKEVLGFDPEDPITGEWLESEHRLLIAGGVATMENRGGRLFIKQAVTTDNQTIEDFEISIGLAEDELKRLIRAGVLVFIGRKITTGLLRALTDRVKFILATAVKIDLIDFFNEGTLSVEQDDAKKTTVNVRFKYGPIYPLNVLDFFFSFDLAGTGTSGLLQ